MKRGGAKIYRKNKRGQFYLLAAFVIVVVLISLASVKNTVINKDTGTAEKVYDLAEELNFESARVIDYGVVNYEDQKEINELIENWTKMYADYAKNKVGVSKWLFVYGTGGEDGEIKSIEISYKDTSAVRLGNAGLQIPTTSVKKGTSKNSIVIKYKDELGKAVEKIIELDPGQMFYFILSVRGEEGSEILIENKESKK